VQNGERPVVLQDGTVVFPNERRRGDRKGVRKNGKGLPPGQAKKIYGGSAKDYAPGQVKKGTVRNGNVFNGAKHSGKKNKGKH
jgi:hypothetical protein